jgi:hypothetical protein
MFSVGLFSIDLRRGTLSAPQRETPYPGELLSGGPPFHSKLHMSFLRGAKPAGRENAICFAPCVRPAQLKRKSRAVTLVTFPAHNITDFSLDLCLS